MKLYNVCNDLSLSPAKNEEALTGYKWVKSVLQVDGKDVPVKLGYCLKHKELHYLKTDYGMSLAGKRVG